MVELLLIAAPAVWSLLALIRLESERGNVANRLQYARNMVRTAALGPPHETLMMPAL